MENDKPWITIARTGTFQDSRGRTQMITQERLEKIAQNYAKRTEDAPVVLGHPEDNDPAHGWITAIKTQGEKLFAQFSRISDGVRNAVKEQGYKYVSMSLFPDGERLRHVGLLGAVPPAIGGLGELPVDLKVAEGFSINFSSQEDLGEEGGSMDAKQLEALIKENQELKAKLAAGETELANARKATETVTADFAAFRNDQAKKDRKTRLEQLTAAGKVMPTEQADILAQAEALAMIPQPMEFSDGKKETPEERFWQGLEARKPSDLDQALTPPADFSTKPESVSMPDLTNKI